MPLAQSDNGRIELRLRPEDKAMLTHAASLRRLDLTGKRNLPLTLLRLLSGPISGCGSRFTRRQEAVDCGGVTKEIALHVGAAGGA